MEIGGDSKQSSDIVQGTSIQEDNIKQVLCDITNIVKEDVKQSVSNSDEVKSLGDRKDIILNISNYEESSRSRKRKSNNISKGNEKSEEGTQTLTNCYREKKIIRIRRKAPRHVETHDETTNGEKEYSTNGTNLTTSRRIQVRYPKTLSPRPNVKTILKYVF